MQEYTVIKKGLSIKPCINIPDEFKNIDLEIKIRPLLSRGNIRRKLESLFKSNEDINPFETIKNIGKWQQEIRDEWQ